MPHQLSPYVSVPPSLYACAQSYHSSNCQDTRANIDFSIFLSRQIRVSVFSCFYHENISYPLGAIPHPEMTVKPWFHSELLISKMDQGLNIFFYK